MRPRSVELARRAARLEKPEEGLEAVAALRAHLDALEAEHVGNALKAGLSWSGIAELLGVTKQAVHKKYASRFRSARRAGGGKERDAPKPVTTEQARQVVAFARQEAEAMGHAYVGPEHLLLGLLRDDRGPAIDALEAAGVSFAAVRREVRRLYGEDRESGSPQARSEGAPMSNRARVALEVAVGEASRSAGGRLGVEHILIALLGDPQGGAFRALSALGVVPAEILRALKSGTERVRTPQA